MKHIRGVAGRLPASLYNKAMDLTPPENTTLIAIQKSDDGEVFAALFHNNGTEPPIGLLRTETNIERGGGDVQVENLHTVIKQGYWSAP